MPFTAIYFYVAGIMKKKELIGSESMKLIIQVRINGYAPLNSKLNRTKKC